MLLSLKTDPESRLSNNSLFMASLFQHRSKAVAKVRNKVIALAEREPVFEKGLCDSGVQANILKTTESRERILKGLIDLRNEEWVSVN